MHATGDFVFDTIEKSKCAGFGEDRSMGLYFL